jgi:hypothetical protein
MKIKQVDETSARAINGRYGRPGAISPWYPCAQVPPTRAMIELRWRLTKDFRPSLTEGTPRLGGPSTPLLGEFGGVYVGIFAIFVSIDG